MATPFSDIYNRFTAKVSDYSFAKLAQADLESILEDYLVVAVANFENVSNTSLTYDDVNKTFDSTLSMQEQNILATLMIVEYLTTKIINTQLMEQHLSNNDYRLYSEANHLKEMIALRDRMKSEAESLMNRYTWKDFNFSSE